jgi:hypothetical protein
VAIPYFSYSSKFPSPQTPPTWQKSVALKWTITRAPFHWTTASSINLLTLTFMVNHHNRKPLTSTPNTEVACYSATPVNDKTNRCHIPHDSNLYRHHQWRSYVLWHTGRIITMAAPNGYYKLLKKSQLFTEFPVTFLVLLKITKCRKSILFIGSIHFDYWK